jgi:hypothetical protein
MGVPVIPQEVVPSGAARLKGGASPTGTMGTEDVVVVHPWGKLLIAFLGVGVADVSRLAQSGLDEAFGFAVGARRVGPSKAMADESM